MAAAIEAAPLVAEEAPSLLQQMQNAHQIAQVANGTVQEGKKIFDTGEQVGEKVFNNVVKGTKMLGNLFHPHHHHHH